MAVSGGPGNTFIVAFKARKGALDPVEHNYLTPIDGIYLADKSNISTLVDTTMDGQRIDPAAPAGSKVSSVGIEREAFRGRWLAITAGMIEPVSSESMAGIYTTRAFTRTAKAAKGTYLGVLEPHQSASNPPSRIVVGGKGAFSGIIRIGSREFPVSGQLNGEGRASVKFRLGREKGPMDLQLISATLSGIPILEMKITGEGRDYVATAACLPK